MKLRLVAKPCKQIQILLSACVALSGLSAHAADDTKEINPLDYCVLIETDNSAGSGFVCNMDGVNYLITNTHVLECAKKFTFKMINGTTLTPIRIELANGRDLARIAILEPNVVAAPLSLDKPKIGDPVTVYGNSEGMKVVTRIEGKIEALGADVVETTAEFVSGNSGSPMVDGKGRVLAVATYVVTSESENWVKKGTKFDKIRRFGVRLDDNIKWVTISHKELYAQSALLADTDLFLMDSWNMWVALDYLGSQQANKVDAAVKHFRECSTGSYKKDYVDQDFPRHLINLSKSVNRALDKLNSGFSIRSSSVSTSIDHARRRFFSLTKIPQQKLARVKWSTQFFKEQADRCIDICKEWEAEQK
jgi:hypothetical protein